jgi:undecaprenyl-diphosphatase
MTPLVAVILGVVEGLTEYLPVSSTGHLILASSLLGADTEAAKSFDIVIQLGAILAVLVHYRVLLAERAAGLLRGEENAKQLALALGVGFAPAAIVGLVARKWIKAHLFGPLPVAAALAIGGAIMIAVEAWRRSRKLHGEDGLDKITVGRALVIGLGQCVSLWPGSSRSMCTIVAGQLAGLSTATAAEFSFLLALPTLGAATIYEGWKARHELLAGGGMLELFLGMLVSFLVAWAVIAAFIKYLQSRGLTPFGIYRLIAAAAVFLILR